MSIRKTKRGGEMERKITLIVAVISTLYFITGCRSSSVERDSFIVSTPLGAYNSDIITWDEQESTIVFLYDTLPIEYYFNFPDTIGGFRPRCIVDSFTLQFFYENGVPIVFVVDTIIPPDTLIDTLEIFHVKVSTPVEPNTWTEAKVDLVPSWLKVYYNPIFKMHKFDPWCNPLPLRTRAHYTFFAHELNTRQEFITEFDITVVFDNFADEW